MKNDKPFVFIRVNQCPNCKGKLELLEEETYVAKLDSKGVPIAGETYVDLRVRCVRCGSEFDAKKQGMHYCIDHHLPPILPIAKDYNPFYQ